MKDQNLETILQSLELDADHAPDMEQWQALLALVKAEKPQRSVEHADDGKPKERKLDQFESRKLDEVDRRVAELENAHKNLLAANSRLAYNAHHDTLTGVYNRAFFTDIVSRKLDARTSENYLAMMFIDFDGFKQVNDTLGHSVGDELLIQISQRLAKVIRKTDYLARMGGDEFTILVTVKEKEHAEMMAERIIGIFNRPVMIDNATVLTSASVGIAIDEHGSYESADQMIRDADTAMYRAKHTGKGRYQIFDQALQQEGDERLASEQELEQAIANEELFVVFQPIVDLESNRYIGAEALVRWDHPERGELEASEFLPQAEELGLVAKIDEFSLRAACKSFKAWKQELELGDFRLGINLSLGQMQRADLIPFLWNSLSAFDMNPSELSIEIAENNLFLDKSLVHQNIHSLDGLGIEILLDGFGTGYSSLSCFNKYKLHGIKIDKSLTNEIESSKSTREMMLSIFQLSKTLNIKPAVEGVATHEQLALLRKMGCRYAQGHLFAKPQRADGFFKTLQSPSAFEACGLEA